MHRRTTIPRDTGKTGNRFEGVIHGPQKDHGTQANGTPSGRPRDRHGHGCSTSVWNACRLPVTPIVQQVVEEAIGTSSPKRWRKRPSCMRWSALVRCTVGTRSETLQLEITPCTLLFGEVACQDGIECVTPCPKSRSTLAVNRDLIGSFKITTWLAHDELPVGLS